MCQGLPEALSLYSNMHICLSQEIKFCLHSVTFQGLLMCQRHSRCFWICPLIKDPKILVLTLLFFRHILMIEVIPVWFCKRSYKNSEKTKCAPFTGINHGLCDNLPQTENQSLFCSIKNTSYSLAFIVDLTCFGNKIKCNQVTQCVVRFYSHVC